MRIKRQEKSISDRDKEILKMRGRGNSIVEIGKYFNLERQRIWQILQKHGDTLPKKLSQK
jgi:DNA-directed RNA polymerase sigma subunit (sigma70/sigma32)